MISSRASLPKRALCIATVLAAMAVSAVATSAPALADPTPLIVVGTSDVSDSNLMSQVIEPDFEKAYPQYDLQYTGSASGQAIATAEQGSADALIVHAASLENQLVDQGFSTEGLRPGDLLG